MFRSILLFLLLCVCVSRGQEYPQGHHVSFYFWSCSLSGRLQDGSCCDTSGDTNCPVHCDVHFFLCLREHNETSNYCNENTSSHVTFFHYAYLNVRNLTFFEGDNVFGAGLDNPLVFPFSGNWSKRIQTVLVARDFDLYVDGYTFEHIDYIDVNWTVPAGRAVDRRSYEGVFRNMVVQIGLKVDCWKGWFGDYCETLCYPRDNSTGHYLCNESGEKECLSGWGGVHCTTGICDPPCPMGASCDNIHGECNCDCGYAEVGEKCECIPHQDCNLIGGYCQLPGECSCRKGFSGADCDFVDFCEYRGNPCHNGGTCVSTGNNTYSCDCATGYQGTQCSFMACPNTGCLSLPCGGHGMCTNTGSGVHCMCEKGFVGRCCDILVNYCLANPCAHGSCGNSLGDYSCSCDAGYTGKDCDAPINECSLNSLCENGGTCFDRINGYSCVCASGYSGVNCTDMCPVGSTLCDCAASCRHGSCVETGGVYSCVCLAGYTGQSCDTDIDDCVGACQNGSCTDGINTFACHCTDGYTGDTCASDIDECQSDPCEHGTCANSVGSYACSCEAAYTGDTCNTFQQLDYCATLDPCQNGGTCLNEPFGSSCECASDYTGDACEEEIDRCYGIICQNGGACQEGVCVCPVSFSGPECSQPVDVCEEQVEPAECNGACVNEPSDTKGYRCECHTGYTGDTCHEDIDDCQGGPCQNGGNCTDGLNQFFCGCEKGYAGETCEVPVDSCAANLCLNGGVCVSEGESYKCECPEAEGYLAPFCEKTEECGRHSCNNKGECKGISKDLSEAVCLCDLGFTGQYCDTLINYCASSPCYHGATCYKGVASYYCRCENNVTGCVESGEPSGSQLIPGVDNSVTGIGGGVALGVILTLVVVLILALLLYALKYRGRKGRRRRESQETQRGRGQRNQLLDSLDSNFINPLFDGTETYPIFDPPSYDTIQYSHHKLPPALYPGLSPSQEEKKEEVYANPYTIYVPEKSSLF